MHVWIVLFITVFNFARLLNCVTICTHFGKWISMPSRNVRFFFFFFFFIFRFAITLNGHKHAFECFVRTLCVRLKCTTIAKRYVKSWCNCMLFFARAKIDSESLFLRVALLTWTSTFVWRIHHMIVNKLNVIYVDVAFVKFLTGIFIILSLFIYNIFHHQICADLMKLPAQSILFSTLVLCHSIHFFSIET